MCKDRQTCTKLMMNKMRELQRKPTFMEIEQDSQMPKPNDYAFYWGSFDRAVDEIWLKVNLRQDNKPIVCKKIFSSKNQPASNGVRKAQKCDKPVSARMPTCSAVNVRKVQKCDKSAVQLGPMAQVQSSVVQQVPSKLAVRSKKIVQTQSEEATSGLKPNQGRRGRKPSYTREDLKAAIVIIQNYFKITVIPNQMQINRAAREIKTPAYKTFLSRLGPKNGWHQILDEAVISENEEASVLSGESHADIRLSKK